MSHHDPPILSSEGATSSGNIWSFTRLVGWPGMTSFEGLMQQRETDIMKHFGTNSISHLSTEEYNEYEKLSMTKPIANSA